MINQGDSAKLWRKTGNCWELLSIQRVNWEAGKTEEMEQRYYSWQDSPNTKKAIKTGKLLNIPAWADFNCQYPMSTPIQVTDKG